MPLRLTITSYHKLTPGQQSERQLDQGSLTIGRGPDNDWVLPDPERLVSSLHCTITARDGAYYLTDNSTNGVLLVQSGLRLRRGSSERLLDGELIRLGEYDLLVSLDAMGGFSSSSAASGIATDPNTSFDALMSRQAGASTPMPPTQGYAQPQVSGPAAHFQGNSPLDTKPDLFDFLAAPSGGAASIPDHVPAERHDFRPPTPQQQAPVIPQPVSTPPASGGASMIPSDWDPFADLSAPAIPDPFANAPPIAVAVTEAPPAQKWPEPPADDRPTSLPPVQQAAMPAADDPWAGIVSAPSVEAPVAAQPVVAQPVLAEPVVNSAAHSTPHVEAPAPTPIQTLPPLERRAGTGDLLHAFLRGAGIPQMRVDTATAEAQMEAIGRSYRQMVEGLIEVLRARSSLKGEFRMQQTTIQPIQNNPLKFAPNVDEALLLLLRSGNQAFLAPDQAIEDGFDDIKAHQMAVMAGVQAAISHLLKRFEPAALENRFEKPTGFSSLLPGARHAQLWESFSQLYAGILREAEDDFQDLFGREFSRAYEEHSARLRRR
jgi:type VI secretion system protein